MTTTKQREAAVARSQAAQAAKPAAPAKAAAAAPAPKPVKREVVAVSRFRGNKCDESANGCPNSHITPKAALAHHDGDEATLSKIDRWFASVDGAADAHKYGHKTRAAAEQCAGLKPSVATAPPAPKPSPNASKPEGAKLHSGAAGTGRA